MPTHQEPYDFFRYTNFCLVRLLEDYGFLINKIQAADDFSTFLSLNERFFRYHIHKKNYLAKILWQLQKLIHLILDRLLVKSNRMEYTLGYMIEAIKI
jgi:hypothetical protein